MSPFLRAAIAEMLPNAGGLDRCAECDFDWTTSGEGCLDHVTGGADRFGALLRDREGTHAPGMAQWSPSAYVWHVGDVTRAWAERLHGLGVDPEVRWAGFDPDELARARRYAALPQATAPWALARSAEALVRALEPLGFATGFLHPEWGEGAVADALRWVAHESVHHELDVRRGLGLA
jgi:hypothetical protein